MNLHIDVQAFLESFKLMGIGLAGIIAVVLVLMLGLKLMTTLFPEKKDKL